MTKKKINRKSTGILNIFADGGDIGKGIGEAISAGGTMIGTASELASNPGNQSIEGRIKSAESYKVTANNNDDLMSAWNSYSPLEEVSFEEVRGVTPGQEIGNALSSIGTGAMAGGTIGGPLGALIGAGVGILANGIASSIGNIKAQKDTEEYNKRIELANARNLAALQDRTKSVDMQNDLLAFSNYAAYGGPLEFAEGGKIHIKPSKRGTFTAAAKRHGKSVQAFASQVLANKDRYSSAMVKKANFARNASKWKHDYGGYLYDDGGNLYTLIPNIGQHGGNFSNGVTLINNGGTHEENPYEGVPMGTAPDGLPNLVEQGEVKFNNYIFSNRLYATKEILNKYRLPLSYDGHSFADIAERLNKESSERPNDPISKRGLFSMMTRLQNAQESMRIDNKGNKYSKGGYMFYAGGYDDIYSNPTGSKMYGNPNDLPLNNDNTISDYKITTNKNTNKNKSNKANASWLRYLPVVGSGIGVITDVLGLTNTPDYSGINLIGNVADNIPDVSYTPIGNYLTYKPLDRNYYLNMLNSQAGATRRAVVNQSGGNRATAMAGLLAADYNALNSLGNLARQSEEYNQAQRERVAAFNRGTDQFNSEMAFKAAMANRDNDKTRLQARIAQAQLKDQTEARASAGMSANITNLFDSLGDIGREEFARAMIVNNPALYYSIDSSGHITYKNGYGTLSEYEKAEIREAAEKEKKKRNNKKKSEGGYLTIRRK